ncbi:hypothetical protein AGLY_000996 [Aphis glycines]|uniref:Reverse transcriptase domain-containing protein n=1 Tax=Aphis glycines TaxID=307491 RepID=A0A6G0U926_APHGL|nr:hypothetical protein AGLY_000996 [Aphis glycines]
MQPCFCKLCTLKETKQVDVIYTGFRKAYDRTKHKTMMKILVSSGFGKSLLSWFRSLFYKCCNDYVINNIPYATVRFVKKQINKIWLKSYTTIGYVDMNVKIKNIALRIAWTTVEVMSYRGLNLSDENDLECKMSLMYEYLIIYCDIDWKLSLSKLTQLNGSNWFYQNFAKVGMLFQKNKKYFKIDVNNQINPKTK